MSSIGSRLPSPTSAALIVVVVPPSRWMPTSKDTRVRRLGLSNNSAACRPAGGRLRLQGEGVLDDLGDAICAEVRDRQKVGLWWLELREWMHDPDGRQSCM